MVLIKYCGLNQVLWCYCHNTIKKLWIRPSIEEIWAKNEVNNCPPVPEKHLLSTLLSSISPHLKVRRLWMLFYQFLHPWYSIRTFIEKSKITLTLFYIGLRSARARSHQLFIQHLENWVRVIVFILNFHSYEL